MKKRANDDKTVIDWLDAWATAIKSNDLDKGRSLFAADASGFGTITFMTNSLDDLVERQWAGVWPKTSGFDFDKAHLAVHFSPDKLQAAIQAPWTSVGKDEAGDDRSREGRSTIILTRTSTDADWKCVHTHFSMWPGGADFQLLK